MYFFFLLPWCLPAQTVLVSDEVPVRENISYYVLDDQRGNVLLFHDRATKFEVEGFDERLHKQWEKEIDANSWDAYLTAKAPHLKNDSSLAGIQLQARQTHLPASTLSFEDVRHRFKLRSTYFGVTPAANNKVLLQGRGYGHGVGLCQIGAMEMAALGYNYSEILHFYYSGVHIIDLSALDFFRED